MGTKLGGQMGTGSSGHRGRWSRFLPVRGTQGAGEPSRWGVGICNGGWLSPMVPTLTDAAAREGKVTWRFA